MKLLFIYFILKLKILANNSSCSKLYGMELLVFCYHPWGREAVFSAIKYLKVTGVLNPFLRSNQREFNIEFS